MNYPTVAVTLDAVLSCINEGFALVVEEKQAFMVEAMGLDRRNIPVPIALAQEAAPNLRELNEKEISQTCRMLHTTSIRNRKVYGGRP